MVRLTAFVLFMLLSLSAQAATVILVPGLFGEAGIKRVTTDLLEPGLQQQGMEVLTAFNNESDILSAYHRAEAPVYLLGHSYGALAIMDVLDSHPEIEVEGVFLVSAAISRSRDLSVPRNYRHLVHLYSSDTPDILLLAATLLPGGMGSLGTAVYAGPNDGRITSIGQPTGHFGYFGDKLPLLIRTVAEVVDRY